MLREATGKRKIAFWNDIVTCIFICSLHIINGKALNTAILIILNGRTPGHECGQCTYQSARGKSTVDYLVASIHCVTAAKSLHVLEEAARYASDHNPLILHIACDIHEHAPTANPSVDSGARVRYDVQRAAAYQEALASLLQQHFIPFIQHELAGHQTHSMPDFCSTTYYATSMQAEWCVFTQAASLV